jgi:hypothetical protein
MSCPRKECSAQTTKENKRRQTLNTARKNNIKEKEKEAKKRKKEQAAQAAADKKKNKKEKRKKKMKETADKKKRKKNEKETLPTTADELPSCPCGKDQNSAQMIVCESCERWIHWEEKCSGLAKLHSEEEAERVEDFMCAFCKLQNSQVC